MSKKSIPVSVLCVLINNNDIDVIDTLCQKNGGCWYPFGNRYKKLNKICKYLFNISLIHKNNQKTFILYECCNNNFIIFYIHKSRSQNGSATINTILLIDKIVISETSPIKIKNAKQNPIPTRTTSNVWLHVQKVKFIQTIDASSLLKHHLFNEEKFQYKNYYYQHYPDGEKLYKSVIPIKENYKYF